MIFRLIILLLFTCFYNYSFAQIQVHEEPLHHPVLSKPEGRVLDVITHPNDTSLIHQHSNNYCYITINGGKIWVENEGEPGRVTELPTGFIGGYFENPAQPLVHRFANRSSGIIRLIAIENLNERGNPSDTNYTPTEGEEVTIDNKFFRVIKMNIQANDKIRLSCPYPTVLINLEEKSLEFFEKNRKKDFKTWAWVEQNEMPSIHNISGQATTIIMVQLKH